MSQRSARPTRAVEGYCLTHRRYMDFSRAHYAGHLVDGGTLLGQYSDIATDLCVATDEHEGLFASYDKVEFLAPVRAGDVLEVVVKIVKVGNRSRRLSFHTFVVARAAANKGTGCAETLTEPLLALSAEGTVVIPQLTEPTGA